MHASAKDVLCESLQLSLKRVTLLFFGPPSLKNNNLSEAAAAPVPTPLPHSQEYT